MITLAITYLECNKTQNYWQITESSKGKLLKHKTCNVNFISLISKELIIAKIEINGKQS